MPIDSYDVKFSPVWKHMFKFPNWTLRRSCEILLCFNTVLINLEQISVYCGAFIADFEHTFFLPGVFITGIASEFPGIFLKSLVNQGIFRGNRSCWLIPLKLGFIFEVKFFDNLLIYKIQYFISIRIFVHIIHIKLFLYVGQKSSLLVQNKTNKVVVL